MKDRERIEAWERLLGLRIRETRVSLGISQQDLARRLSEAGFSAVQTTIAKIEAGTRPLRISEFVGIANALGMPWQSLLSGQAPMLDERDPIADLETRISGSQILEDEILRDLLRQTQNLAESYAHARADREALEQEYRNLVNSSATLDAQYLPAYSDDEDGSPTDAAE